MRVGLGYDIHPLIEGRPFVLGGKILPFTKGPQGHSDGDCLFHAITDALLGAMGLGDMGHFFPDTDSRWEGASSSIFLEEALKFLKERQLKIGNLDTIVHLEKPKLAPHLEEIRKNIAKILECSVDQINVKTKRGEGLDAVGRGEAIAAQAIVLIRANREP